MTCVRGPVRVALTAHKQGYASDKKLLEKSECSDPRSIVATGREVPPAPCVKSLGQETPVMR